MKNMKRVKIVQEMVDKTSSKIIQGHFKGLKPTKGLPKGQKGLDRLNERA